MPITITLPSPDNIIAPWSSINLQSSFVGPLPVGSRFIVSFYTGLEPQPGQNVGITHTLPTQTPGRGFTVGIAGQNESVNVDPRITWRSSTQVKVTAELEQPGGIIIDSGTVTGEWQPTSQILSQPKTVTDGGALTPEQALQLSETHLSTALTQLVDQLTLQELSEGPSPGPINAQLPEAFWGIIVRIATVPPGLEPQTPDDNYWVKTLAVVRIFRGSDLWMRVPVHTSSKMIPLYNEHIAAAVPLALTGLWILNMTLQVSFAPGVTGQVFMMKFP